MQGTAKQVSKILFGDQDGMPGSLEPLTWPMFRDHKFATKLVVTKGTVVCEIHIGGLSSYPLFEIKSEFLTPEAMWTKPTLMIRQQSHSVESVAQFLKQVDIISSCFIGVVKRWESAQKS